MSRSLASRVARARRARGGFTLVELLVATVAGLIVATSVIALSRDATTTFQEEIRASAAESSLRLAAERLRADIQRAGYMGTPNAYNDPAIERGTNQYGTVYDATHPGIKNMVGLTLTNGGSTDATYTNAATVASYSGFNALNPDTVTVSGNMTTSDQYLGNYMAGQGGCGVARFQFSNDDPAVARLLQTGVRDAFNPARDSAGAPIGAARFMARVFDPGRNRFAIVPVCATSAPGANPGWIDIDGPGIPFPDVQNGITLTSWVANPVQTVRWRVRRSSGASVVNMDPPVFPDARFELVREWLDATLDPYAKGAPIGEAEVVAEYAVDLKLAFTGEDNITTHNVTQLDFEKASILNETWTTSRTNVTPVGPAPQRIRSVRYRLATRASLPDRERNIAPVFGTVGGSNYLYRYCFDAACTGKLARVRTFVGEVSLVNQSRVF